jgi:hypothetical protein
VWAEASERPFEVPCGRGAIAGNEEEIEFELLLWLLLWLLLTLLLMIEGADEDSRPSSSESSVSWSRSEGDAEPVLM